jgi:hypothetical protein
VFRSNKPKITDFRADYATHADFCGVFRNDTKRLYLLAFLLTANHKESEQCLVSTIEEIFKEPTVFREWTLSEIRLGSRSRRMFRSITMKGYTLSVAKQVLSGRMDAVIKTIERNVGLVGYTRSGRL